MFLLDTCDIGIFFLKKKVNANRAEGCLLQQLTDVAMVISGEETFSCWFNIHFHTHTTKRSDLFNDIKNFYGQAVAL